ncbi:MAG: protoporphyrinogen oxidase [Balneolaceae bacterium]|nr:protoporphyrinogen oxidase [Balneolaceae bacterium]
MNSSKKNIGVLGAGISGLSVAYELKNKGYKVTVYEKADEPGGVIRTKQEDNWILELGPNTLLINSTPVSDFLDRLGLKDDCIEANPVAKKRFIIKNGEPVQIPLSAWDFLFSNLFSAKAKLKMLKEPFIGSANTEETIADFFIRRLGKEPLDYGVNPFVSGVYAGDPEKLSIKHTFSSLHEMEQNHGSIIKGMIASRKGSTIKRSLVSFKDGMQALPKKIAFELSDELFLNTEVSQIAKQDSSWKVKTQKDTFRHDAIISTIPAHTLSKVLDISETNTLTDINYAPMSVLHLGFHKESIKHPLDGFGMLIPKVENYNLLGCLFSSTLFEQRAPKDHALLTCFMGGARNPELAHKPKEELYKIALRELQQLLGTKGNPVFKHHTFWSHAIPQYELGYDFYLRTIEQIEKNNSGLFISGNFRNGVSVPDRIAKGIELAERIESYMQS